MNSTSRLALLLATFTVVGLLPSSADASGFYLPGRGVTPMGRGGAYVASSGGDLNAIWYNPANLALLEETQLTVDASVVGTFSKFQRAPRTTQNGETETYDEVHNEAFPATIPQILIGGPTGVEGLSWAAGLFTPYAGYQKYPEDGPQRYTLIDQSKSAVAYVGASLAYQLNDNIRIGAGVQNMVTRAEFVNVVSGYTGLYGRPEDRDLDVLTRLRLQDLFVPTGNFGAWVALSENVEAAISAQLPATIRDADAEVDIRKGSHPSFDNAEVSDNTVQASMNLPMFVRAALRYSQEEFDLELAGVFEQWSVFDRVTVQPNDISVENVPGVGSIPIGPTSIPQQWRDTFSVRLGGDYRISEQWTVRAGYAFETGAPLDEYYNLVSIDSNKHLIGGGLRHSWGDFQLDASMAFYALENREIENSRVRQINPSDTEDELATIVGNGTYKTNYLVVGTGLNWVF